MILHYLKIALRNLLKYRTQSAISVLGLAVGLGFFTFGYHWLKYETSYDSFYPDADRSYLVSTSGRRSRMKFPKTDWLYPCLLFSSWV